MASKNLPTWTRPVALLIAVSAGSPGNAQSPPTPPEFEAITVVAPRIITQRTKRQGGSILPSEVVQRSAEVKVSDLDLTRTADLYTLEERVRQAATVVCEQLVQQFPEGEPSAPICTRRAVDDAMARVRQMTLQAVRSPSG